jgi:hypothetical protein
MEPAAAQAEGADERTMLSARARAAVARTAGESTWLPQQQQQLAQCTGATACNSAACR